VTHGQHEEQDYGAEPELTEDHLDRTKTTQGELDEQEPRSPQDREEIEAKQASPADRVCPLLRSGQGLAGCLEVLVQVDNLTNLRMLAHQHSV
jgi:hypothetical protein